MVIQNKTNIFHSAFHSTVLFHTFSSVVGIKTFDKLLIEGLWSRHFLSPYGCLQCLYCPALAKNDKTLESVEKRKVTSL